MSFLLKLVPIIITFLKTRTLKNLFFVEEQKKFDVKAFCSDLRDGSFDSNEMYGPIINAIFNSDIIIKSYLEMEAVEDSILEVVLKELEKEYLCTFYEEDKSLIKSALYDYFFSKRF